MQDHYDVETESMMSLASALTLRGELLWNQIRRGIRERVDMFVCGRQQAPEWIRNILKDYEWLLDIRWSFEQRLWLIERYSRRDRAWVTVLEWNDSLIGHRMVEELRVRDMWRFPNPEAYLEYKHMLSARKRAQNRVRAQEGMLEAVDSLSTKEIENFIEVENAFRTGETVVLMGDDAVSYERMTKSAAKAAEAGETIDPSKARILSGKTFSKRVH